MSWTLAMHQPLGNHSTDMTKTHEQNEGKTSGKIGGPMQAYNQQSSQSRP